MKKKRKLLGNLCNYLLKGSVKIPDWRAVLFSLVQLEFTMWRWKHGLDLTFSNYCLKFSGSGRKVTNCSNGVSVTFKWIWPQTSNIYVNFFPIRMYCHNHMSWSFRKPWGRFYRERLFRVEVLVAEILPIAFLFFLILPFFSDINVNYPWMFQMLQSPYSNALLGHLPALNVNYLLKCDLSCIIPFGITVTFNLA